MLTRIYHATLIILAAGVGSLPAVANAAESCDLTNCGVSAVTTISASPELTVLSIDTKGIGRSNSANKAFDNSTYQCVSVVSITGAPSTTGAGLTGAQRSGTGYCKFMDPDGDFVVGETMLDSTGGGTWKFLQGTGKWKGITGGGKFVPLTSGKPIVAGTSQGCANATGTYEVPK